MLILVKLFSIFAVEIVPHDKLKSFFMKYFIISPRGHQFAIQRSDGFILRYFDGVTYSFVAEFLSAFLNGKQSVELSLF